MKQTINRIIVGAICLLGLSACVVQPAPVAVGGPAYQPAPYRACPIGYHLGPEGRRCWPN